MYHEMFYFYNEIPNVGEKFVAFYADGSGCNLFKRKEDGSFIDAHGEQIDDVSWFEDSTYLTWVHLPDDFGLFYEGEDE